MYSRNINLENPHLNVKMRKHSTMVGARKKKVGGQNVSQTMTTVQGNQKRYASETGTAFILENKGTKTEGRAKQNYERTAGTHKRNLECGRSAYLNQLFRSFLHCLHRLLLANIRRVKWRHSWRHSWRRIWAEAPHKRPGRKNNGASLRD